MARERLSHRFGALALQINQRLAKGRGFGEIKKATLIAYGITLLLSVILLSLPLVQKLPKLNAGEIAQQDIRALMDLRIADQAETDRLKKNAHDRERPALDRDFAVFEKLLAQLKTDTTWISRTIGETAELPAQQRIALLYERLPFLSGPGYLRSDIEMLIREKKITLIEARAVSLAEKAFNEGGFLTVPLAETTLGEALEKGVQIRTINSPRDIADTVWGAEQLQNAETAPRLIVRSAQLKDEYFSPGTMRILFARLRQLQKENPYLSFNAQYTALRRQQAADKVTPVYRQIKRGTTLIRAGDLIDAEKLALLGEVRDNHRRRNGSLFLGIFIVMGVLAVAIAYFTFRFAYEQMRDYASHCILHLLFAFMFIAELVIRFANPLRQYDINFVLFVPFGFFGILTGQFFGARIALSAGIFLAIFSYILTGFDNQSLMLALTSAISGLYASTRMQKRTQMFKSGVIIAVTNLLLISGFELMAPAPKDFNLKVAAVLTNSVLGILLTLGLLPLIEFAFNLPTPFRLMELNDFNHPLLTRMAAIAPSTHSHSVMLANLSEAAVRALGGDTLLTRVGCLFHDIGKMVHPDFYAENRHLYPTSEAFKKLGPLKSAQMITKHVTDGITMARQHRLPEKVISFIPEHHGTTTIQYFYHKALEERRSEAQALPQRKSFQYPGPQPQTRETAVAMIADSVEAASRSATSATADEFRRIIDRIIENKISEEQFHEAPLTLGDLDIVRKAFLDVLVSTYHERPQYPTMQQTAALETQVTAQPAKRKREVSVQSVGKKRTVSKKRGAANLPELID